MTTKGSWKSFLNSPASPNVSLGRCRSPRGRATQSQGEGPQTDEVILGRGSLRARLKGWSPQHTVGPGLCVVDPERCDVRSWWHSRESTDQRTTAPAMDSPQGPSGLAGQVAMGPATGRHPRDLALCQRDLGLSKG